MKPKSSHPLYSIYSAMKQRCLNPDSQSYCKYGAKGITVDNDWLGDNGFWQFLSDMGERPPGYQIDRIDPSGNYSKENCRWISTLGQSANRRTFKQNKSGYKGVSWSKQRNKWRAAIAFNKKDYVIGYFENKEDAARAYNQKALELHGEFTLLNIIKVD